MDQPTNRRWTSQRTDNGPTHGQIMDPLRTDNGLIHSQTMVPPADRQLTLPRTNKGHTNGRTMGQPTDIQ
ncbi:hypothetical protein DPMN_031464 [Dreissena polymorpha]|uniref:Uncharacterized protein n=1 Tax=Dreissena polymorpha TaxID=45954 RepID=A0A9D4RH48_DREPO|nr:hypothetical protein DPMN_031464 [Dreissena polymorpha]